MNEPAVPVSAMQDLAIYVCPKCQGALRADLHGRSGSLTCERAHRFRVEEGLPRFVDDEGYAGSFGFQWNEYATTQLDFMNQTTLTRDRLFRGTGWPERLAGERILEAGCGSGRFTEVLLSTGAEVVTFDFSRAADVTFRHFGDRARVCQASIYEMPYRQASFDRVFCYGVIQHTPDVRASFFALVAMLKPGGRFAFDVYDSWKLPFNARYRVRFITKRMNKEVLLRWLRRIVPLYHKLTPPLHPYNQLLVPIKDYRGQLPGATPAMELEMSVLDTFDALSPEFDQPQSLRTMKRWCREAGLVDVMLRRGGNGIEGTATRPG